MWYSPLPQPVITKKFMKGVRVNYIGVVYWFGENLITSLSKAFKCLAQGGL